MSTIPRELEFHHLNYYAFGSCKEVGKNNSNLVGALTKVFVNIYKFEDRGSQFMTFRPTLANIVSNTGVFFMPKVDGKMFLISQRRGMLLSSDGSTTFLDGIDFGGDLVCVTRDEKIISIKIWQEWNREYGLKCLVWDSNGHKTETSFSALCPQSFSHTNLSVKKVFESADEDDLLSQDGWPFIFNTEGSPYIASNVFHPTFEIDFSELEIKDVNDNPLGVLLNERDQIWRLKSEVGNFRSSPPDLWKIQGLECQGFIRNLGTDFQNSSEHYDLEERVRQMFVLAFLTARYNYEGGRIDSNLDSKIPFPLSLPNHRAHLRETELYQDD